MATILVIDDTPANLVLASKLLRAAGHEVLTAGRADDGIALARRRRPDLVLMDLGLPDVDGTEALRVMRAGAATADVRVVAFTAYAMRGDRDRVLAHGFDGYLTKPVDVATFGASVEELLP